MTSPATAAPTWPSPTDVDNTVSVLLGNGDGTFALPASSSPPLVPRPWWPTSTATAPTMCWCRRGRRHPLSPGHPRAARHLRAARHGQPRITPRATSPGSRTPIEGPSSPASTPRTMPSRFTPTATAVSSVIGSLTTGQLPAQIIAADLSGDGLTDLVVRNAGDGTLSVYFATTWNMIKFVGPVNPLAAPTFLPPVTLPVGLGVSDVQAVDTTGAAGSISSSPTS